MIYFLRSVSISAVLFASLAAGPHRTTYVISDPPTRPSVSLQVWPNPALAGQAAHLHLTGLTAAAGTVAIRVRSASSSQILMQQEVAPGNSIDVTWSLENYAPGVYLVEVSSATGPLAVKLLVR